ncbi:MAG TPA: C39 family peptidase [Ktedonobacterales bacterium]|nr:C39 family peptidase [Ktedonobacterales bacterium]
MRQRSDLYSDYQQPGANKSNQQSGKITAQRRSLPPRISLPQRAGIVDSTLEEVSTSAPRHRAEAKAVTLPAKRALPALPALPASTSLEVQEPITNADFQVIPRTHPSIPSIKGRGHASSPRMTIIKLAIVAVVVFSVLGATLATAGEGGVAQFLFSALDRAGPYNPLNPTSASAQITKLVQPIIQAEPDAGYDSQEQHDTFWNAACSAASLAEILRAWGVQNVTIGHVIDVMSEHNPAYITPWGGLMSQDGWDYTAQRYHFQAKVQLNYSLSFNDIIRTTVLQGLPVVLGLRDNGARYYPAFAGGGHFLVAVGGNSSGVQVVDSSLYRISFIPVDEFNYLWTGETIIITPA